MRVIVCEAFTDASGKAHPYGEETTLPAGPELDALLKAGTVREDDRMTRRVDETPRESAAAPAASPGRRRGAADAR